MIFIDFPKAFEWFNHHVRLSVLIQISLGEHPLCLALIRLLSIESNGLELALLSSGQVKGGHLFPLLFYLLH